MNETQTRTSGKSDVARKAAAVLEVAGVLIAGYYGTSYLVSWLGIKPLGPAVQAVLQSPDPDYVSLSVTFFQTKSVQYGGLLLLAFAVGWWRRRLSPRQYGLTTAGQSFGKLVGLGLVAFALCAFPVKVLWVARRFVDLGEGSPFWALLDKSWTPSFWLFMAVASFAVQPVFEELLFRGYCQTRLEEDFGGMGAIVIGTLFFVLGHDQYHHLSFISIGNIITLILCFLGLGYLYWSTRSLIPGIVLHGALNFPTKGIYDFLLLGTMLAACVVFRTKAWNVVRDFCRQFAVKGWKGAAWVGAFVITAMIFAFERRPQLFILPALAGLAAALLIEYRQRKSFSSTTAMNVAP